MDRQEAYKGKEVKGREGQVEPANEIKVTGNFLVPGQGFTNRDRSLKA